MTYKTPEERAEYARKWRAKHRQQVRMADAERRSSPEAKAAAVERTRQWRAENPEQHRASVDEWQKANPDKVRKYAKTSSKKQKWRLQNDPEYAERRRAQWREWAAEARAANPEFFRQRLRGSNYRRLYGLTLEQFEEMTATQDGLCAVCGCLPNGRAKFLCIDHDHETNAVRQLLCHGCNTGIGAFKDDPELLRAAADYIDRHRTLTVS